MSSSTAWLSPTLRLLTTLLVCGPSLAARAAVQAEAAVMMVPGTVTVGPEMQSAVAAALGDAGILPEAARYFAITDVRQGGDHALVSVIGLAQVDENLVWGLDDGAWFGLALMTQADDGQWRGAVQGTAEFSALLQDAPGSFISPTARLDLDPLRAPPLTAISGYIFPWQPGTSMLYGYLGVHTNGWVNGWKAVDMLSDGNEALGHAPNRVLAAQAGSIGYKCTDANNVAFRLADFFYTHLIDNAGLQTGTEFAQGAELGQMKVGSFGSQGSGCGWATQSPGTFHVHWGFADADLQVEDWSLSMSTENWTNGTQTVTPGDGWIIAGASPVLHAISGNAGVPDATLNYDDAGPKQVQADSFGVYSLSVPDGWSGVVTPGKAGFTFSPASRTYTNVVVDGTAEDYIAAPDIIVYRSGGLLFHNFSSGAFTGGVWLGNPGGNCIPAPMDRDGDGALDLAQFCGGNWNFYNADGSLLKSIATGISSGLPLPADYDGDGDDDVVVFQAGAWQHFDFATGAYLPANSRWTGFPGGAGKPVSMDYDGDGDSDMTILSANGAWHFYNADGSYNKGIWIGNVANQLPVPGDYDGDSTDEAMVFRGGAWLAYDFDSGAYLPAESKWTGAPLPPPGGVTLPAPLDYDADGRLDLTVYAGGPWHFYGPTGSYFKGIWVGAVAANRPLSRRLLP